MRYEPLNSASACALAWTFVYCEFVPRGQETNLLCQSLVLILPPIIPRNYNSIIHSKRLSVYPEVAPYENEMLLPSSNLTRKLVRDASC